MSLQPAWAEVCFFRALHALLGATRPIGLCTGSLALPSKAYYFCAVPEESSHSLPPLPSLYLLSLSFSLSPLLLYVSISQAKEYNTTIELVINSSSVCVYACACMSERKSQTRSFHFPITLFTPSG